MHFSFFKPTCSDRNNFYNSLCDWFIEWPCADNARPVVTIARTLNGLQEVSIFALKPESLTFKFWYFRKVFVSNNS
jgi:hypothetical protein